MQDLTQLIESQFLPFVQKPMQYIGNEINIVRRPDISKVRLHGVLCFPETYDIGMSHYGGQILYHIVNSNPVWALSRCYHPMPDAHARMKEAGIPLFCLEYHRPVSEADWIGFSVTYELQFTNILSMLSLAGIPVTAADRTEGFPLVIAGGCAVSNPEPIADFIDAFVIGDGEESVVTLCTVLERSKARRATRQETLAALSECDGVYVPSLRPVKRSGRYMVASAGQPPVIAAKVCALKDSYYPSRPLVPLINVVHHRLAIEVMRGCTRGCRFCSAGMTYRPVREREATELAAQIEGSIAATGWRDIGLLSLSTADYSDLKRLLSETGRIAHDRHLRVSLPSTRIDALCPGALDALAAVTPLSSFTIAPEAGTQRLRDVINKGFSDKDISAMVDELLKRGVQTIKVYFMIGLPTERDDDIDGIIRTVGAMSDAVRSASRRTVINVALSPFSPKPHTPFQWEAMDTPDMLLKKSHRIKNALRSKRNVKVSFRDPFMARLETVMARGDRTVGACVLSAWKNGALFDGRDEHFVFDRWRAAFEASGGATDMNAFCTAVPLDQPLPWSVVSTGVTTDFLAAERERASAGLPTQDCRSGTCGSCGVCTERIQPVLKRSSPAAAESGVSAGARTESGPGRHCYRFVYEKGLPVRFLGHLDMMNVLLRALLAARLPLAYSEGFHSHPLVAFGPPLPLGVAAENDMLEVTLSSRLSIECATVNDFLPQGLCIRKYFEIPLRHQSLNEDIRAGHYSFSFSSSSGYSWLDSPVVGERISRFLAAPDVPVVVQKDGEKRVKNIRRLVLELAVAEKEGIPSFEATLSLEPKNTCRPSELLAALFPETEASRWIVCRKQCLRRAHGGTMEPYGGAESFLLVGK
jgi:radical SAM family uncharacterized protein/radical SAM-linked protein